LTDPVQLLAATFETTNLAQIVVSPDGQLMLTNQAARQMFALVPNDLGCPLQDLPIANRPLALQDYLEQSYRDRHSITVNEVERSRSDGTVQFLDVQLIPLHSPDQALLGCSITFQDVTLYTQLKREFQSVTQELATTNEELQSTQEELATMNEALQVTNEELETTNEELQATNEELETINEELQSRNEELEARIRKGDR
jgi:two-component system, chemotaxis family, CheB/CheR fusion protein